MFEDEITKFKREMARREREQEEKVNRQMDPLQKSREQ